MKFPIEDIHFTKGERQALYFVLAAMILMIIGILVSNFMPRKQNTTITRVVIDSIFSRPYQDMSQNEEQYEYSTSNKSKQKFFPFDPNTTSLDSLKMLPMPNKIAYNINNYRAKGGKYKKPEDLKKIYGIEPYYDALAPYIDIKGAQNRTHQKQDELIRLQEKEQNTSSPTQVNDKENIFTKKEIKKDSLAYAKTQDKENDIVVEINSANEYQLQLIKGIGPYYSNKIATYRDELGGFYSKNQFQSMKLPEATLAALTEHTSCDKSLIRKRNVNTISQDTLRRLPNMNSRKASAAYNYIQKHRPLKSRSDLQKIRIFTEEEIDILMLYLRFE